MIAHHIPKREYMGFHHLVRTKSFLNRDYIFREMEEKYLFFDWNCFFNSPTTFFTGALNCHTGATQWYGKQDLKRSLLPTIASTAVPFLSTMVEFEGDFLLDGGLLDAIPIKKSVDDGNHFHVIVLTQDRTYRKKYSSFPFASLFYQKHPKLVNVLQERHKIYNQQLNYCYQLEQEGKAIILQPNHPVKIGRFEQNQSNLLELYRKGYQETFSKLKENPIFSKSTSQSPSKVAKKDYLSAQNPPPSRFF